MRLMLVFLLVALTGGCGLHSNTSVWEVHDRIFECDYSQTEAVLSPTNQQRILDTVRPPISGDMNGCDHWSFSGAAPRRLVYDCVHFLNTSGDCRQFTTRMFQCDACYTSWRSRRRAE